MKMEETVIYALKSISKSRLRSYLTILGMVIGVVAIVVILSISEGFQQDINKQLSSFGANQMTIIPLASSQRALSLNFATAPTNGKLYQKDVDSINSIAGVVTTARSVYGRASLTFKNKSITSVVYSSDKKMFEEFGDYYTIESGRFYSESEKSVAVLGAVASTDLFGKDKVQVGSVLTINGKEYRVVGILKKIGQSLSSNDDSAIYIPFEDGKQVFKGQLLDEEVGVISVKTNPGFDQNKIKNEIERKIASNHRVRLDEKDFSVITLQEIQDTVNSTLGAVQIVLGAVALIASIVGAIGIANTMFMNVLDKTKEIGILKALGTTQFEILKLFLTESALIGFAGGLVGLIFGWAILQVLTIFGVPVFLRLRIIIFVFVFSVGVGVMAGAIPAYRASKLDPVVALRD